MLIMKTKILILLAVLFVGKCFGQIVPFTGNLEEYYFPYKKMFKAVTYVYKNYNDTTDEYIWKMQTIVSQKDTLLDTKVFDAKDILVEETINKISNSDVVMTNYSMHKITEDSIINFQGDIHDSLVFSFHHQLNESIRWQVQLQEPVFKTTLLMTKNRVFDGYEPHSQTIKFTDKYFMTVADKEYLSHINYTYYAKVKGIVKYSIIVSDGITKLYVFQQ